MSVQSPSGQLALQLPHAVSFDGEDFFVSQSNEAALALIEDWPDWPGKAAVVWGPPGSGKSHLAAIWSQRAEATRLAPEMIVRDALAAWSGHSALVVEDVTAPDIDETAMFHLLNMAREDGFTILMTATESPAVWPVALADLRTRLRALSAAEMRQPDDALLRAVMVKLFTDRQLSVDEAVVSYVLSRTERSLAAVTAAVDLLDRAALAEKVAITRPFASRILRDADT